jgi:glyoxylase-like metal-dependent hydrolase (beta-lactamase superfamily II)
VCDANSGIIGIELVLPLTLFDTRYELNLEGSAVHLIYVGPCHQIGDTIVHLPEDRVAFAGDVLFRQCTRMGWTGSYEKWFHSRGAQNAGFALV